MVVLRATCPVERKARFRSVVHPVFRYITSKECRWHVCASINSDLKATLRGPPRKGMLRRRSERPMGRRFLGDFFLLVRGSVRPRKNRIWRVEAPPAHRMARALRGLRTRLHPEQMLSSKPAAADPNREVSDSKLQGSDPLQVSDPPLQVSDPKLQGWIRHALHWLCYNIVYALGIVANNGHSVSSSFRTRQFIVVPLSTRTSAFAKKAPRPLTSGFGFRRASLRSSPGLPSTPRSGGWAPFNPSLRRLWCIIVIYLTLCYTVLYESL